MKKKNIVTNLIVRYPVTRQQYYVVFIMLLTSICFYK